MKILFLSKNGDALGVGQQLVKEGHTVLFYIKERSTYKYSGEGIVDRVDSWRPHLKDADLIVADMVGFGQYQDVIKERSIPALSINRMADLLELDRGKAVDLFEKAGIRTPTTYKFGGPEDAATLASTFPEEGLVIKPSGNIETAGTRLCRTRDQYEWALDQYEEKQALIVQEILEGTEVSVEGWFNGRDFITPFNMTFEEKKLLPDGYGPNTGCMGNLVQTVSEDSRLVQETLMRLKKWLVSVGYRGPIDLNCIVNEDGPHVLEATARMGYDAIEALMEGLKEPMIDLLFETAMGTKKEMDITDDPMIAVRVSVPPWPHGEPDKEQRGMPIEGLIPERLKHIYMTDVYKEGEEYKWAAGDGVICKVTAHGRDLREAIQRVYRTAEGLEILDKQYRTDVGARAEADLNELKRMGML